VHDDISEVIPPTCTEAGYTKITCQVCGDTVINNEKDALGHNWIDATVDAPKTCSRCGETEGEPLPKPVDPEPTDPVVPAPEKDHAECQGDWFAELINAIINFFRTLFGLPEKCICGEDL
jgi:hypothetical protein